MHYIRLLSPPKVTVGSKSEIGVSAVLAVTTDLGDDFYGNDLILDARLVDGHNVERIIKQQNFNWQAHARALKISLTCPGKYASRDVYMHVSTRQAINPKSCIPTVLDVWSAQFHLTDKQRAESFVERRFALPGNSVLRVVEGTGDSIARHVWDASLGFLIYLEQVLTKSTNYEHQTDVTRLLSGQHTKPLQVIELGSGCGTVGIALAQLIRCDVVLTDLDDAEEIMAKNRRLATPKAGSTLSSKMLDWSEGVNEGLGTQFSLVLVSDCIYNPDSSVHLVKTLRELSRRSPAVNILVGYKRRHSADKIFFDHMQQAGFRTAATHSIQLPQQEALAEDVPTIIEFYEYQWKH